MLCSRWRIHAFDQLTQAASPGHTPSQNVDIAAGIPVTETRIPALSIDFPPAT